MKTLDHPRSLAIAALALSACAGQAARTESAHEHRPEPSVCVQGVRGPLSPQLAGKLAEATDVLTFETVWKAEHSDAVAGSVARASVLAVIRGQGEQIRACYEAAMDRLPDNTRGKVVVRFVIDAAGQVPAASIADNELGVPEVACCLAERVAQWSFPPPSAGNFVVVEYPFSVQISH